MCLQMQINLKLYQKITPSKNIDKLYHNPSSCLFLTQLTALFQQGWLLVTMSVYPSPQKFIILDHIDTVHFCTTSNILHPLQKLTSAEMSTGPQFIVARSPGRKLVLVKDMLLSTVVCTLIAVEELFFILPLLYFLQFKSV